ncbi:lipopolysaccharide biosynthesis protein [Sphingobacterium siyangense]|uniref:lipopolysaccharide biosynthesis protein n=1 Tax=Sphingobacterium siyangense TaxID=459529 RepID=UPI003DA4190A
MSLGKSFLWSAIERFSIQIVQFVVGVILARILGPSEYGVLGILLLVNSFLQVFIDSGFSKALIQKQDRTHVDISSVFIFNLLIGLISYLLLFLSAPVIERFYEVPKLAIYIRTIGFSLILNSFFAISQTRFIIALNFKIIAKVNFISALISGVIAVFLAYNGYGIWALIYQVLLKSSVSFILFFILDKERAGFKFSLASLQSLFGFGSNVLISSLLNNVTNNLSALFIAKIINTKSLGFYTQGTQFTDVAFNTINLIYENVLMPSFVKIKDNLELLKVQFIKVLNISIIVLTPIFLFLCVFASPIIQLVLSEKWLPAAPIVQFFALSRLISILANINISLLYSLGHANLVLKQQYFKIIVRIVFISIALPFGIYYVAFAELLSTIVHFFINTYYPGKILKISGIKQIMLNYKVFISASGILFSGLIVNQFTQKPILELIIGFVLAMLLYVVFLRLLRVQDFIKLIKHKWKIGNML